MAATKKKKSRSIIPKGSEAEGQRLTWERFEANIGEAYSFLEPYVVAEQSEIAQVLGRVAEEAFRAKFERGEATPISKGGKYVLYFLPTRIDTPGRSFEFNYDMDEKALERHMRASYADDYVGIRVSMAGVGQNRFPVIAGRVKTSQSAWLKNINKIEYHQDIRQAHSEAPFVRTNFAIAFAEYAKAELKVGGHPGREAAEKWLDRYVLAIDEAWEAEQWVFKRVNSTIQNATLRDMWLEEIEGCISQINEHQRKQPETVVLEKPERLSHEPAAIWPFDGAKSAGLFYSTKKEQGEKDALDKIATDGLRLLAHYQYEKIGDYPRISMVQPIFAYLESRMPRIRKMLAKPPDMPSLMALPSLVLEYGQICQKLPEKLAALEKDTRPASRQEKFEIYNQAMASQSRLLSACTKTLWEIRKLPVEESSAITKAIHRLMMEVAKTNFDGKEKKLPSENAILADYSRILEKCKMANAPSAFRRRLSIVERMNEDLHRMISTKGEIPKAKDERKKLEKRLRSLITSLYLISPVEADVIQKYWNEQKMHGIYKSGKMLSENLASVLLPEKMAESALWFDQLSKDKQRWARFWQAKKAEVEGKLEPLDGSDEENKFMGLIIEGAEKRFLGHFGQAEIKQGTSRPSAQRKSCTEYDKEVFFELAEKNDGYFKVLASAPAPFRAYEWRPSHDGIAYRLESWHDRQENFEELVEDGFRNARIPVFYDQQEKNGVLHVTIATDATGRIETEVDIGKTLQMAKEGKAAPKAKKLDDMVYGDEVSEEEFAQLASGIKGESRYMNMMRKVLEGIFKTNKIERKIIGGRKYQQAALSIPGDYSCTVMFGAGGEVISIYPQIAGKNNAETFRQIEALLGGTGRADQLRHNISQYLLERVLVNRMYGQHRSKYQVMPVYEAMLGRNVKTMMNERAAQEPRIRKLAR